MIYTTSFIQPLFLSASSAAELVRRHGVQNCISEIAKHIRADFLRWQDFDKSARIATVTAVQSPASRPCQRRGSRQVCS